MTLFLYSAHVNVKKLKKYQMEVKETFCNCIKILNFLCINGIYKIFLGFPMTDSNTSILLIEFTLSIQTLLELYCAHVVHISIFT